MRCKRSRGAFASYLDGIASGGLTPKNGSELNFQQSGKHVLIMLDYGGKRALHGDLLDIGRARNSFDDDRFWFGK